MIVFCTLVHRILSLKMKPAALILLAVWCITAHGQVLRRPITTSYTGLGAYSIRSADVFSFLANPASLVQLKYATAGIYGERRFLLSQLNNYTLAAALPTSSGHFGLAAGYFGFSDYNETQIGLAYARKLGNRADIGVRFNYNSIRIAGYGNASAIGFEAGTVFHITPEWHAGVHVSNPVGGKFGKEQQEKLPAVYTAGIGYEASEKFFISMEIGKEEDRPVNINAGLQYQLLPVLLARAGIATATSSPWLGIGIVRKTFRVDVTTSYHPQLGFTPGLLLIFNFKQTEE